MLRFTRLSLALFKTGILFVDYIQPAFPSHDLAINAAFFDGCPYFHFFGFKLTAFCCEQLFYFVSFTNSQWLSAYSLLIPEYNSAPAQVIRTHLHAYFITRQNPYIIHPHLTRNGSQYFMTILQFHLEHSVAKCFYNNSVLFN